MDTSGVRVGVTACCPPAARPWAGWAWNPKGPQVTPFCHQMGRRGIIWDLKPGTGTEFRPGSRRGGPGAQIPTFVSPILDPKIPKSKFSGKVSNLSATRSNGFGAQGPKGPMGAPRGPQGAQGAPWAPCWGQPLRAVYPSSQTIQCPAERVRDQAGKLGRLHKAHSGTGPAGYPPAGG